MTEPSISFPIFLGYPAREWSMFNIAEISFPMDEIRMDMGRVEAKMKWSLKEKDLT